MKKFTTVLAIAILSAMMIAPLSAQRAPFDRFAEIAPDTNDVGGFGDLIAGVDLDGDGKQEIYAVNNDWFDLIGKDLVPRIYKYEQTLLGDWEPVWSTRLPFDFQNTWPGLDLGDLDGDGKQEVIWGPVNNFGSGINPNPIRIAVFETPGDGSDNMGVDNGDGTWAPNASWTITPNDNDNLRPIVWHARDIDNDGTEEIVAFCRVGDGIQIYSTDDVPDTGGGTENWTLEYSGVTGTFYDGFVMNDKAYGVQSNGTLWSVEWDGSAYALDSTLTATVGGGSWNSAEVVDIDGDGTDEAIIASWSSSTSAVYLVQTSGDSVTSTLISDVPDAAANRLYGGAAGDTDNDGNMDFVFGTRQATPNGLIYRLEYQGGAVNDPGSYVLSAIDSLPPTDGTQFDALAMGDMDGDGTDEALYTGTPRGGSDGNASPIVVLNQMGPGGIDDAGNVAEGFELKQNYPNPFNPETTIQFEIPTALDVRVNIYNALGQKVRSLLNENRGAGVHTVKWDGRDANGSRVASGMYIYSMTAGNITLTKRMTLLK